MRVERTQRFAVDLVTVEDFVDPIRKCRIPMWAAVVTDQKDGSTREIGRGTDRSSVANVVARERGATKDFVLSRPVD